jgi:hypothetical protein
MFGSCNAPFVLLADPVCLEITDTAVSPNLWQMYFNECGLF